jgi:hypothetical protein
MRNSIRTIIVLFTIMQGNYSLALELPEWSWQGGLVGPAIEGDVFDDEGPTYPGILCDTCRDPDEFPLDFAAVAYNGHWGEEPWMRSTRLGIPFRIYNLQREWVVAWFEGVLFDAPTFLPNTLDIRLRLPSGRIVTITVLQGGPDMPVGPAAPAMRSSGGACSCGGGGEGDDDDYAEPEEFEIPEIERFGVVDIVDPDEDGEFDPWEEEL